MLASASLSCGAAFVASRLLRYMPAHHVYGRTPCCCAPFKPLDSTAGVSASQHQCPVRTILFPFVAPVRSVTSLFFFFLPSPGTVGDHVTSVDLEAAEELDPCTRFYQVACMLLCFATSTHRSSLPSLFSLPSLLALLSLLSLCIADSHVLLPVPNSQWKKFWTVLQSNDKLYFYKSQKTHIPVSTNGDERV